MADFATLKGRLGRRCGFDGNPDRLGDFVNDAVQFIWGWRSDWAWALRTFQLQTRAPLTGSAGTVTNGSTTVSGLSASTAVLTGAKIALPDGIVYNIASRPAVGTTAFLSTPYAGTTVVGTAAWTIYFDIIALPGDCSEIESLVATGDGWENPIRQRSVLPQQMRGLPMNGYESCPIFYALDSAGQMPPPRGTLSPTDAGAGDLSAGAYTWRFAYRNKTTGEEGPLSPPASLTLAVDRRVDLITATTETRFDYERRIYRTVAGGTELYFDFDAGATGTFGDNVPDAMLGALGGGWVGAAPRAAQTQRLRLWPPPAAAYVLGVSYYAESGELVRDEDVPGIPARFHQLVLDYAQSLYLREQEQHAAAASLEGRMIAKLGKMSEEQDADPSTVVQIGRGFPGDRPRAFPNDGSVPRYIG